MTRIPTAAGGQPIDPRVLELIFQLMGEVFWATPKWIGESLLAHYQLVLSEIPPGPDDAEHFDGIGSPTGSLEEARRLFSIALEERLRREEGDPELIAAALAIVTGRIELL